MVQFVPGRVDDHPTELYINITGKLAILNEYHPLKPLRFQVVCYQPALLSAVLCAGEITTALLLEWSGPE